MPARGSFPRAGCPPCADPGAGARPRQWRDRGSRSRCRTGPATGGRPAPPPGRGSMRAAALSGAGHRRSTRRPRSTRYRPASVPTRTRSRLSTRTDWAGPTCDSATRSARTAPTAIRCSPLLAAAHSVPPASTAKRRATTAAPGAPSSTTGVRLASSWVEQGDAIAIGDPQAAAGLEMQRRHRRLLARLLAGGDRRDRDELVGDRVVARHAGAVGADPQGARRILRQRGDEVVGQAARILRIALEQHEAVAVVAVQPALRRDPDVAGAILQDRVDRVLRQRIVGAGALEVVGALRRIRPATATLGGRRQREAEQSRADAARWRRCALSEPGA